MTLLGCGVSGRQNVLGYRAIKVAYSIFDGQLKIEINFKKYSAHDSGYLVFVPIKCPNVKFYSMLKLKNFLSYKAKTWNRLTFLNRTKINCPKKI